MKITAYFDGGQAYADWLKKVLGPSVEVEFRKLPTNNTPEFTKLPAYVADILFLDKSDFILSGSLDGVHEKPLMSIELAGCTPQYQHALQRFSRMMASVSSGCPATVVMPAQKRENSAGERLYKRSAALDYGAVRLMDVYEVPTYVFDWPDKDGTLLKEPGTEAPCVDTESIRELSALLQQAIKAFENLDYLTTLRRMQLSRTMVEMLRTRAYNGGPPTPERPGGGSGGTTQANLKVVSTQSLIADIRVRLSNGEDYIEQVPQYISSREKSLVFSPTRVIEHAGDPYVGMIGYYDIAFCRQGKTTRDRIFNLVADCKTLSISEVTTTMNSFNREHCPFVNPITPKNVLTWAHHLRHGCRHTKIKPIRIYSELADMVIFRDGLLVNAG